MFQLVTQNHRNLVSLNRTTNLDSSSETSPSAPSISSPCESSVSNTTTNSNVTPVTPSKKPRSHIITTSPTPSSHITSTPISRPPLPEIPYTPRSRSQPSIHTPIIHIPHLHTVAHLVNYKQSTAIKTARVSPNLPSKLDIVEIPDNEYTPLPSLHLPSESSSPSQLYPPLKPLRHPSTSLTNLLESSSEYNHYQTLLVLILYLNIDTILDLFQIDVSVLLIHRHSIFQHYQATLHYAFLNNTLNLYPLILHILRALPHNLTLPLD